MTVENETTVAAAIADAEAEINKIKEPVTDAEALSEAEQDEYLVRKFCGQWTEIGQFDRPKKSKGYGFVHTVFVPPQLAEKWKAGDLVSVHFHQSKRGPVCDGIVGIREYLEWHPEIISAIKDEISGRRANKLEWLGKRPESIRRAWEEKKAAAKELGLTLVEIIDDVETTKYGGRGATSYIFEEQVDSEMAERVLDVLNGRHADNASGPYEHGHDLVSIIDRGFVNNWCGPWTD